MDKKELVDIGNVTKKFVEELKKRGVVPQQVLLYGSRACGKAHEWSDIDLIVISEDFAKIPPLERLTLLAHAAWSTQAAIEAFGYTPQEIAEHGQDSILWEEIQNNNKVIYKEAA